MATPTFRAGLAELEERACHQKTAIIIKVTADAPLLANAYDLCIQAGVSMEQIEVQTSNGFDKVGITCSTSEAVPLTKSFIALRSAPGMEAISITLRNPTKDTVLFPLFSEGASAEQQPL